MNNRRWITGLVGLALIALSLWQILAAGRGLSIVHLPYDGNRPPMTFIGPQDGMDGSRPLVLIAHGFAGSGTVMRGFAFTLAKAGYVTAIWDFDGHGSNPRPIHLNDTSNNLLRDAESVLSEAVQRGYADPQEAAILGHSMGSGVALLYGQVHPETRAAVAVSPVGQAVTPELPHNLLLMAGSLEPNFVQTAQELLAQAGGAGGDPADGTARTLVVIPGVEHVTILFKPQTHQEARAWMDAAFGPQPEAQDYTDRRMIWFGLGVLGTLLAALALAPCPPLSESESSTGLRPLVWRLAALIAGALAATLLLWFAGNLGLPLSSLFGLLVGGYLFLWYGLAGAAGLLLLWQPISLPDRRALWSGLVIFAALWLGVGLLGGMVWLPWLLIPRRLALWVPGALLLLPWFLAVGGIIRRASALGKLGWWLLQSVLLVSALWLAIGFSPELGFLMLILPIVPLVLGLHALAAGGQRSAWSYALSGSLFVSWLLLAVFPLQ